MNFKFSISNFKTLSLVVIASFFVAQTAHAAVDTSSIGKKKIDQLGGEQAVMPGNPFYWTKNAATDVKGFFVSRTDELKFKLGVADDKASELLKLSQIAPDNKTAIAQALVEYQKNILFLKSSVNRFVNSSGAVLSWEPIAEKLSNHLEFVDDMLSESPSNAMQAVLFDIRDSLRQNLIVLLSRLNRTQMWINKTVSAESTYAFSDLRAAELLRGLSGKALQMRDSSSALFQTASENLINAIALRITEQLADADELAISDLSRLAGCASVRLESLTAIMDAEPSLYDNQELQDLIAKLSPQ